MTDNVIEGPFSVQHTRKETGSVADQQVQLEMAATITDVASVEPFKQLTVFGINPNGTLFLASDPGDVPSVLIALERVKQHLMSDFKGDRFE